MHNQVKVKVKVIPEKTKVYKLTNPPKIVKKIVRSILQNLQSQRVKKLKVRKATV